MLEHDEESREGGALLNPKPPCRLLGDQVAVQRMIWQGQNQRSQIRVERKGQQHLQGHGRWRGRKIGRSTGGQQTEFRNPIDLHPGSGGCIVGCFHGRVRVLRDTSNLRAATKKAWFADAWGWGRNKQRGMKCPFPARPHAGGADTSPQ